MYGQGLSRRALITENVVVDAPMPSASANPAMMVNAGVLTSIRAPKRRSFHMAARPQLCCDTIVFHHATVEQMHRAIRMLREARIVRYHAKLSRRRRAILSTDPLPLRHCAN